MKIETIKELQDEFVRLALECVERATGEDYEYDLVAEPFCRVTERIMAFPGASLEALRAKACVAYYWNEGNGTRLADEWQSSIDSRSGYDTGSMSDIILSAVELLAPEFKSAIDAAWIESHRKLMRDADQQPAAA